MRKQRLQQLTAQMTAKIERGDGRFAAAANGTVVDRRTGFMWCILDSFQQLGKCIDYNAAAAYVRGLKTGGYSDWRIPTSAELAGIYKREPYFPHSGTAWYWTNETFVKGYYDMANVVTSRHESVFRKEQKRFEECGAVRAVRK